ncbi:MAG: MBL fold metallo-hydrolase [Pseudomonadota bacterium]
MQRSVRTSVRCKEVADASDPEDNMQYFLIFTLLWAASSNARDWRTPDEAQVTLEYIAHAAFRLVGSQGTSLLVDPYQSRWWIGYDFPSGLPASDAVLLSHPHPDHDAGYARGATPPWSDDTRIIDGPGDYTVGAFSIRGIGGRHAEPYGEEFGRINTIWRIEVAGLRVVHIGDNEPLNAAVAAEIGDVDVIMLPVDDEEHILSFEEVERYRRRLKPLVVVPMHYRHDDLESDPDRPGDLGSVDGWFARQPDGRQLGTHTISLSRSALKELPGVWVLEHSPLVTRAE